MSLEVNENEIKQYKKLKIIGDIALIKEHIKLFEKKYALSFHEYEKTVAYEEEDYKKWDDYIEWKAYIKIQELSVYASIHLPEKFHKKTRRNDFGLSRIRTYVPVVTGPANSFQNYPNIAKRMGDVTNND